MKYAEYIEKAYNVNIKKIEGGSLFGVKININDPKQVAVAFYFLSQQEHNQEVVNGLRWLTE